MTAIKNSGARSDYITHIIRAHTSLMLNLTATNKSRTDLHTRHTVLSRTNCSSARAALPIYTAVYGRYDIIIYLECAAVYIYYKRTTV